MFQPAPLPRNLEASFRDLASAKAATRASAVRDVVRHALRNDAARERAIPALVRVLQDDAAPGVRAEAAVALADVAAHEALPSLLVAVEDDDVHVRQMALAALGEIGDTRARQRVERALRDARPEVRYQAVIAFSRIAKDEPASIAAALLHALDDEDDSIRYIAMRIAEETGVDGEPLRDEGLAARAEKLLSETDEATAVVAALYLARVGQAQGCDAVLAVVAEQRKTPEVDDEQACIELAGELGMREAVPHLERRVWGARRWTRAVLGWGGGDRRSCAWHSRIALARMGHERARAEILADLSSWRRDAREAAVVAAGRARMTEARGPLENLGGTVDAALVREALVRLAVE